MAHSLAETSSWDATVDVPDDGDDESAASVELPFQELTNRTLYLQTVLAGYLVGGDLSIRAADNKLVVAALVVQLAGKWLATTADSVVTLASLAANTWYYVYVYNNAGAVGIEYSTTVPNAALWRLFKTGDVTRRYLGCFRTDATPTAIPMRKVGNRYTYRRSVTGFGLTAFRPLSAGVATVYTDVVLTSWLPPHVLLAHLDADLVPANAAGDSASLKTKGDGVAAWSIGAPSPGRNQSRLVLETDTSQTIQYLCANGGGGSASLTLYVAGFEED